MAVPAGPTCSVSQGSAVTSVSHHLISEKHLKTGLCLHSPDCCHFDGGNWLPHAQSSFLLQPVITSWQLPKEYLPVTYVSAPLLPGLFQPVSVC